jgi:hypothetical protein
MDLSSSYKKDPKTGAVLNNNRAEHIRFVSERDSAAAAMQVAGKLRALEKEVSEIKQFIHKCFISNTSTLVDYRK